jgi:hypothetical protein
MSRVICGLLICVAVSSLFARPGRSTVFVAETDEVLAAAETVLADWRIPVQEHNEMTIVSKKVEIAIDDIAGYVDENQPDATPGWTRARVWFEITAVNKGDMSQVTVAAFFERYGTRSALLLIPPSWVAIPSNGTLEQEFIKEISTVLSATEGGIR